MARFCLALCALSVFFFVGGSNRVAQGNDGGPWICPQWPVMSIGNQLLYYSYYFHSSCDDDPSITYSIGHYDWPLDCPDCDSDAFQSEQTNRFMGLGRAISAGYEFELPEGPAQTLSDKIEDHNAPFIQFENRSGEVVLAKVFYFSIPRRSCCSAYQQAERIIAVALEVERDSTINSLEVIAHALHDSGPCFAYNTVLVTEDEREVSVLILTAN